MKTMKLNLEMDPIACLGPTGSRRSSDQPAKQSKQAEGQRGPAMPVWACGFFPLFPLGALKEGL
jgi:hypothetical protein